MKTTNRREFLGSIALTTLAACALPANAMHRRQRVFVASGTADGILAFDWDPVGPDLASAGVAARIPNVDWVTLSSDGRTLFAASEVDSFHGKPTGEVASFRVLDGVLQPLSEENSAGKGTCQVAVDQTGTLLLAADYGDGSAAGFPVLAGSLNPATWSEHFKGDGPKADRQASAHAHFASFSPDNRFAYINDLGGDAIHIFRLIGSDGLHALVPAGSFRSKPGAGPRVLRFHPNGHTAYSVNELDATIDVLEWSPLDGSLTLRQRVAPIPSSYHGDAYPSDLALTRDGRFAYLGVRGEDQIYSFRVDAKSGTLTFMGKTAAGGKFPRHLVLDPTENWLVVANQKSDNIAILARNRLTGALAATGKSFQAATPMCVLFA